MFEYVKSSNNIVTAYLCLTSCLRSKMFELGTLGIAVLPGYDKEPDRYRLKIGRMPEGRDEIWFLSEENEDDRYKLLEHVPTDIKGCSVTWYRTELKLVTGRTAQYARLEIVLPGNFDWTQKLFIGGIVPERRDLAPVAFVLYEQGTGKRREFQIYEGDNGKPLVCLSPDSPALPGCAFGKETAGRDTVFPYKDKDDAFLCAALRDPESIVKTHLYDNRMAAGKPAIDTEKAEKYLSENFSLDGTSMRICLAAMRYWNTEHTDGDASAFLKSILAPIGFDARHLEQMSENGILHARRRKKATNGRDPEIEFTKEELAQNRKKAVCRLSRLIADRYIGYRHGTVTVRLPEQDGGAGIPARCVTIEYSQEPPVLVADGVRTECKDFNACAGAALDALEALAACTDTKQ